MAIKYRVRTKKDNISPQKGAKYYAVPVRSKEINMGQIAEVLSRRSSLSVGDVYATLIGMVPIIEEYLHDGCSVRVDGLGIFTVSASSEGFSDPKECVPRKVKAKKICFRADVSLKKNLKSITFKRDEKP